MEIIALNRAVGLVQLFLVKRTKGHTEHSSQQSGQISLVKLVWGIGLLGTLFSTISWLRAPFLLTMTFVASKKTVNNILCN